MTFGYLCTIFRTHFRRDHKITKAIRILICCGAILAMAASPTIAQETLTRAQYEKMVREHKDRAVKMLASDSAEDRYFALGKLRSVAELPNDVANKVIEYLADLRGLTPGNTVAGGAAELLAEHPQHARGAISQLLKLLSYTEKYGYPAGSAAVALGAIDRHYLEVYIAGMAEGDRKALAATLKPIIQSDGGSRAAQAMVCEIYSMLGPDAIDAIGVIKAKNAVAAKQEEDNPYARVVRIRCDSALRIIQSDWRIGDPKYIAEMRRADAALGKLDAYITPNDRFSHEWENLLALMEDAGVKTGYVIRHDNSFPFQARVGGIPMARLIANEWHSFLFDGLDLRGRTLPQKPMILLTDAGKKTYAHTFHRGMDPQYLPLVQDFILIEIGANGQDRLNQFLKNLGISEGYNENVFYAYWPNLWWSSADKILPKPPPEGNRLLWLKTTDGEVVSAMFGDK